MERKRCALLSGNDARCLLSVNGAVNEAALKLKNMFQVIAWNICTETMKFHGAPDWDMNAPGAVHQDAAQGPNFPWRARQPGSRGNAAKALKNIGFWPAWRNSKELRRNFEGTLKEPSILYRGAGKAQKLRLGPKR